MVGIEKHVKIDGVESADASFSLTVEEYAQMVRDVRAAKMMIKGPDYGLTSGERSSTVFRRSLFAVRDIAFGEKFSTDNVRSIRPGYGIKPKYYSELIGKKAKRDIRIGEPILMEDL